MVGSETFSKPNTLDDLLAIVPGLGRRRSLNADWLRLLLDRQRRQCTWCGEMVPPGRSAWCSDQCVGEFKARCDPNTARRLVLERDGGICQACGRDTLRAEQEAKERRLDRWASIRPGETAQQNADRRAANLKAMEQLGYGRGVWREVDHYPAVSEYGGLCPVSQMRLLCGACHARVTAELSARRKGQR